MSGQDPRDYGLSADDLRAAANAMDDTAETSARLRNLANAIDPERPSRPTRVHVYSAHAIGPVRKVLSEMLVHAQHGDQILIEDRQLGIVTMAKVEVQP